MEAAAAAHAVPDNVALVKRAFDAFSARDVAALLEIAHPKVEIVAPGTAAFTRGGRSYRGYAGVFSYFRDVERVWAELELIPQIHQELDDAVVVFGRLRGRAISGFLVDEGAQWLFRIQDGKIVCARACETREDALLAARSEDAAPAT